MKTQLLEKVETFESPSEDLSNICLPSTLEVKHLVETDNSHESKQHNRFKSCIVSAFSNKSNDSLEKVCLNIANKIKKMIHIKEKPNRPILCAIIPKSTYNLDAKTRD